MANVTQTVNAVANGFNHTQDNGKSRSKRGIDGRLSEESYRHKMTTKIDKFGSVSGGLDRAQLGDGPRNDESTNARPSPEAIGYRKPSIRQAIKDNLLSAIVHPRYGTNKIKAAIREKHEASNGKPTDNHNDEHLPTLAPQPLVEQLDKDRLTNGFEEKPQFPPAKEFLRDPVASIVTTIQDQRGNDAAENLIKAEVTHGADVQLLHQAEKVENAPDGPERDAEYETFVQMKHLRQDAFVRWTMDRHVRIVARRTQVSGTPPRRPPAFASVGADSKMLAWTDYGSRLLQYEVEKHGQYYIDPEFEMPMPDRKLLASVAERLIVASTPLQSLVMKLWSVSHWDDPTESAAYMGLYFFLLFFSYLTRALVLYVLLKTLYRGWHPPTLADLRDTVVQAEDQHAIPRNLSELVVQNGQRAWTEHIINQAGPAIFDLGERLADMMEMARNFFEWRNPWYTGVTLSVLFAGFIVMTITPTWLLVQITFLSVGIMFFVLVPLAARYPRYRYLLSPATWLFWRSPTHAEWAISRIQTEARQYLASDHKLKAVDKDTYLIGTYTCHNNDSSNKIHGKLIVLATSVSFSPKQSKHPHLIHTSKHEEKEAAGWYLLFDDIREIHKITIQNSHGGEEVGLEFADFRGEKRTAMHLAKRNEVFSQIIGFSGAQWKRCG